MGLDIAIGLFDNSPDRDEEGHELDLRNLAAINAALREAGLPEHREPEGLKGEWIGKLWYSEIHYLRQIAAYQWAGLGLPPVRERDDTPTMANDDFLDRYYSVIGGPGHQGMCFDHLLFHSDSNGFYVPIDFEEVIYFNDEAMARRFGGLGSSVRLARELAVLADVLAFPVKKWQPSTSDWYKEMNRFYEHSEPAEHPWQRYPLAADTLLTLHHACRRSIQTGAVIVFC